MADMLGLHRLADEHPHRQQCVERLTRQARSERVPERQAHRPLDGVRPRQRSHHFPGA